MLPLCVILSFCFAESCDYSYGKLNIKKKTRRFFPARNHCFFGNFPRASVWLAETLAILQILAARKDVPNTAQGSGAACAAHAGAPQATVPSFCPSETHLISS